MEMLSTVLWGVGLVVGVVCLMWLFNWMLEVELEELDKD